MNARHTLAIGTQLVIIQKDITRVQVILAIRATDLSAQVYN